ncbi:SulP family inorganic anion transporter [Zoogloea sp.]|uniref:SLC26A/SulP transporter family protein n=1 Tax=Zoogloea sp. TaxID=49181 RepID=UPI00262F047D|nr:SulP family inorganic anion transporter [Zoogloea sp.]MDD3352826.1 SulP family inorganic anion transporter [Zoogloea sp.]
MDASKTARPWPGDLWGGLAATLVALPSAIAFGVTIFSPLGPGYGAQGALAGILGATVLGLIAPALGGTDRLITAPCAPAAAVLAALAIGFAQQGVPPQTGMLMLILIGLLAGAIQMGLGFAGIGSLIKYIPYPVVCGYLSGVGLTIIGSQLPRVLGVPEDMGLQAALLSPASWRWESIVVGLGVILTMLRADRLVRLIPAAIIAMGAGICLYLLLGLFDPALRQTRDNPLVIGPLSTPDASLLDAVTRNIQTVGAFDPGLLAQVVFPALTLAVLLSIDTLKTCIVLDTLTNTHHRPDRELVAQGLGNLGSALLGGIPGAGQMGASMVNLASGGQTRRSGILEGGFALLTFLFLSPLVAWIPIAALGGILMVIGYRMIDQHSLEFFRSKATRLDFIVIVAVIVTALSVSLIAASAVGIVLAIALYLNEQSHSRILRRKIEGGEQFSKVVRHDQELSILTRHGSKTVIVELQGSLFFGTAHQLYRALEPEIGPRTYVILNLRRVQSLDLTATHVLEQIKDRLEQVGAYLIFAEIPRGLPSGLKMKRYLKDVGLLRDSTRALAFRQLDDALEWVEGQILRAADYTHEDLDPPLELAELEHLLGWLPTTLTSLAPIIAQRHFSEGEKLFEAGAPGGDLLFIRRGTVRVEIALGRKELWHIGTFGRGDFIGEMGFLDSTRRVADAIALTETDCFILSRERFDAATNLAGPEAGLLFEGLAKVLAMRVRFMNRELRVLRG